MKDQVRVVTRYTGSRIKGLKRAGIKDHSPSIWNHNARDRDQQYFSCNEESGIKFLRVQGSKSHHFWDRGSKYWVKYGISYEKIYLVTTLTKWLLRVREGYRPLQSEKIYKKSLMKNTLWSLEAPRLCLIATKVFFRKKSCRKLGHPLFLRLASSDRTNDLFKPFLCCIGVSVVDSLIFRCCVNCSTTSNNFSAILILASRLAVFPGSTGMMLEYQASDSKTTCDFFFRFSFFQSDRPAQYQETHSKLNEKKREWPD